MNLRGNIAWISLEVGYGYISDDASNTYIFHHSNIVPTKGTKMLSVGNLVSFTVQPGLKAGQASDVKLIS
ncbi:cold shock domain-containing protein [Glutamicibacter arilaitensis]|uniref:cold shock domain-containing protein n=1 Tax=Glutamicibacter arilaitensis TaxID=256701 RepID=UPI003FD62ED6